MTIARLAVAAPPRALSAEILATSGLVSYHKMHDTSIATAADAGPGNFTGSYDADCLLGVLGISGTPGKACLFGTPQNLGSQLSVPFDASFVQTSVSVEFCVRFNRFDTPTAQIFDAFGFNGPQVQCISLGGGIGFSLKKHSGSVMASTTSGAILDTYLWHHVVVTWDGTTAHIYVDGIDRAGATTSQTFASGGGAAMVWGSSSHKAAMAHCAYYSRALTFAEVSARFAAFQSVAHWPVASGLKAGLHQGLHNASSDGERLAQIAAARTAHATVSRSDFRWDLIQASNGGAYDWSLYDTIVSELHAGGFRTAIFTITLSPLWASGGGALTFVPGASKADSAFLAWVAAYQVFVTAAIARYKPGGAGNPAGLDIYWEIWNEPNDTTFWTSSTSPQPDAAMYATLYKALRTSIRAADPFARVSWGVNTEWYNTGASSVAADKWTKTALAESGIQIDYASFHPYVSASASPDDASLISNLFSDVLCFYDTLCAYGFSNAKILISEIGWSTASVSQANQAAYMAKVFSRVLTYWSSFVTVVNWYRDWDKSDQYGLWSDMPASPGTPTAKTAAAAYAAIAAGLDV